MAIEYSSWCTTDTSIPDDLVPIFERFLLGSMAIGASVKTRGFMEELGIANSVLAENLLSQMKGDSIEIGSVSNVGVIA